jgi:hypothetical protein
MLGFHRAVAKLRAYLLRLVGSAAREKTCCRWCKFRRDLQEHSGCAMSARVGHRLTFTRHLSRMLVAMIKIKPPRYQTLIERSITAGGFETEKYYVIDSRTNARIVKCRNQQESEKIASGLNAATKFRWVKLLSD